MNKEYRDWLEEKKRDSTSSYLNNGKLINPNPDIEKELQLVIKKYDELHNPAVIPQHVGEWITIYREKYDLYPALRMLENNTFVWGEIYEWYRMNTREFVNAYLTGEYEVEEPLYYALVKGHELLDDSSKYWSYSKYDSKDFFISYNQRDDSPIIVKDTKSRWNELGINDSNADFVKVEEELN